MRELLTYQHKIKTAKQIQELVGARPRDKQVIMCHGVFDVVHPGHVRHLLYAKSKADTLIASLTADRHVTKGVGRPHVPQDLRAMNLAAFEAVDYVLIDQNPDPLQNLKLIQPDYFAKGFEYVNGRAKTEAEATVLSGYGGELLFTPGDVVYSSSNLIATQRPDLRLDKLQLLMHRQKLTFSDLHRTINEWRGQRVHVIGDTIVDSQTRCVMVGSHGKTPTMSVRYEGKQDYVGGAAVVAKHLAAAGAWVTFSTVLGDDKLAEFVLDELKGITVNPVVDRSRPTVNKNAIVVDGYRLLKIDTVDNSSISDDVLARLDVNIRPMDAVVFSDFRHGIFNPRTIPKLIHAIPDGCYRVADSQVASRWGNIADFQGFDLITPNEREARFALGDQDSGIRPLVSKLYDVSKCALLIMKLGERGVLTCCGRDHEQLDSFMVLDSFVDRLIDPVGAGDALLAYATLARDPTTATILGTMAASIECERDGNIPVTADDVHHKLDTVEKQL